MGTTAQVCERTLSINSNAVIGDFVDELQFVRLCSEELLRLLSYETI